MRYIIMAAGEGKRWSNYLGVPKHLIEINGETLLGRTTRLLRENNITDYIITCNDPRYALYGPTAAQTCLDCEVDRFEESLINGPVCYLYGDVYYTDEAIKTIISNDNKDILFFGSEIEIFAIKVHNLDLFLQHKHRVKELYMQNTLNRCIGWEVYRSLYNIPFGMHQITQNYIKILDGTDDIDYPRDYENFKRKIQQHQENWIQNCISVIIPCYNNAENTKILINKLLKQKEWYPETEIIIVENGSTEDMSFLDKYNPEKITILHEKIAGVSHARNIGLNKSKGEYIAFIDNDDDISENYLHLLYQQMRANNSQYDFCIIPATTDGKKLIDYSTIDTTNPLPKLWSVWHYCYNRRIIKNIRYNEKLNVTEDIDWLNRVIPKDKKNNGIVLNSEPIYFYKWINNINSLSHRANRKEIPIIRR